MTVNIMTQEWLHFYVVNWISSKVDGEKRSYEKDMSLPECFGTILSIFENCRRTGPRTDAPKTAPFSRVVKGQNFSKIPDSILSPQMSILMNYQVVKL